MVSLSAEHASLVSSAACLAVREQRMALAGVYASPVTHLSLTYDTQNLGCQVLSSIQGLFVFTGGEFASMPQLLAVATVCLKRSRRKRCGTTK